MPGYPPQLEDHLRKPRNVGPLEDATGRGFDENPVCGDVMTVWVKVEDGVVTEARFEARGCDPSIAAGSVATEMVAGRTVEQAEAITSEEIAAALGGLPTSKRHCGILASRAVRAAIRDARTGSD